MSGAAVERPWPEEGARGVLQTAEEGTQVHRDQGTGQTIYRPCTLRTIWDLFLSSCSHLTFKVE